MTENEMLTEKLCLSADATSTEKAEYIVKMKNDEVWIIETKGGETAGGQSKNIDIQIENKFNAFKS